MAYVIDFSEIFYVGDIEIPEINVSNINYNQMNVTVMEGAKDSQIIFDLNNGRPDQQRSRANKQLEPNFG